MKTEKKCPQHPNSFLFAVCDEEVCGACQDEWFTKNPPPRPPLHVTVPVWDAHHGKWDLKKSVPAK